MVNSNITTELQWPTYACDPPHTNLGLGIVTYNADGLDFDGLNKIWCWMQVGLAGRVYVADARCNGRGKDRWTAATRAALGPHAKLNLSAIDPISKQCKVEDRARVVGSIIILNEYWGVRAYDWFKDKSSWAL